jgi:tryptophan synthase alpha chain
MSRRATSTTSGPAASGPTASGPTPSGPAASGPAASAPDRSTAASGVQRIAQAFAQAAAERRAALMPYLMGGYPTLAESVRIGEAYVAAGADIVELGVPYSDPLADGPVIHAAATQALAAGANLAGVLEVARTLAPRVPVVLMCYANMVFAPGTEAFVERLARSGACGLIVPDLPLEEAPDVLAACDAQGLALVPLVAPTTPPQRMAEIGARARGFLYTVSVVGTTGERAALAERFAEIVAQAKAATGVPVALGFGISTPEHARQAAAAGADGVIVGTRLVRAAGEAADPVGAVGVVVAELASALRG